MFQQAFKGYQESLGHDHVSVSHAAHNLSLVEISLGRFREAEDHLRRALQVREMVLQPNDTSTLDIAKYLGLLLLDMGRAGDDVTLLQNALNEKEKVLGPDHVFDARHSQQPRPSLHISGNAEQCWRATSSRD